VKRFLVTTAIEQTWPKDGPVLFLGEWCRLYNRKSVWEKMDAEIAPYHWDDRVKLRQDYQYIKDLYETLLEELTEKLNKLHRVEHSLRYWRILLGPWLGQFTQILYDRWFMLKYATREYQIRKCRISATEPSSNIPNDYKQFDEQCSGDWWNEAIYGQLIKRFFQDTIEIEEIKIAKIPKQNTIDEVSEVRRTDWKQFAFAAITKASQVITRPKNFFFINTYLPLKADFRLQLKLGQIPKLWASTPAPESPPDSTGIREWKWKEHHDPEEFSVVARYMIPKYMPKVYLEGYQRLINCIHEQPWPAEPKGIFTSCAYNSDDVFKAWAAEKVEAGSPFVIGQHGGNMGMSQIAFHEEHQIKISDAWVSWGWADKENSTIVPMWNLKNIDSQVDYDPEGGAVLVGMTISRYSNHIYSAPVASQWLSYFDEQCRFISALPENIRHRVLVRQYQHDYGWQQKERWQEKFPDLRLDDGSTPMHNLVEQSRLYISTYNATTYLESLGWNIPSIVFWNPAHWELRESAIPYFDMLRSVGIFHDTPESAARQITEVWGDISSWWLSTEVQDVRREFCHQYSRQIKNPVPALGTAIRQVMHSHHNKAI